MLTNIQSLVQPLRGIQDSYIVVFAMRYACTVRYVTPLLKKSR